MSPRRRSSSGLDYRTWVKAEAQRAMANYKKRRSPSSGSPRAPNTAASLARLQSRAIQAVNVARFHNEAIMKRNMARVKKMLKEINNYQTRHAGYRLVQQPNGSWGLMKPTKNR